MKKCEQFRDLILSDHMDGELDRIAAERVQRHLLDCGECRAFLKEVASISLKQAPRHAVPPELWATIKEKILQDKQKVNPLESILEKLQGLIIYPRLVPVFASLILMLVAGSVSLNTIQIQQTKDKEQGEYLVSLLGATSSSTQADNNDLGTPIEHYFL